MNEEARTLERARIASPCTESWDEMVGNDEVRFCSHCSKHVHNFAKLTRQQAEDLVARSQGSICARIERRADASIVTRGAALSVRAARLRATRWTGAAFAALVGLLGGAAVHAQDVKDKPESCPNGSKMVFKRKRSAVADDATSHAVLSGTVTDANGAVIPIVKVTLTNERTKHKLVVATNDDGVYRFPSLMPDTYKMTLEHVGFETVTVDKIIAKKQDEMGVDVTLPVNTLRVDVTLPSSDVTDSVTVGILLFTAPAPPFNLPLGRDRLPTPANNAVRDNR